ASPPEGRLLGKLGPVVANGPIGAIGDLVRCDANGARRVRRPVEHRVDGIQTMKVLAIGLRPLRDTGAAPLRHQSARTLRGIEWTLENEDLIKRQLGLQPCEKRRS